MKKQFRILPKFLISLRTVCAIVALAMALGILTACTPTGDITVSPPPVSSTAPFEQPSNAPSLEIMERPSSDPASAQNSPTSEVVTPHPSQPSAAQPPAQNIESNNPATKSGSPTAESTKEQLFYYLSELFAEAYSPYYDGLHYEMNDYEETADGNKTTATFLWTMYYLGKGWDVGADEGVEQQVNWKLQATTTVHEDGTLDFETISVFSNSSVRGPAIYDIPIEEEFPTQLTD